MPKVDRYLHLPVQSGDNEVLRRMNRHYTAEKYLALVKKIRQAMPDIALSTDTIVGFPGETDEHFARVYDFVQEINFSKVHVFSFSAHEKAPAFYLPGHIDQEIIKKRSAKLRELSEEMEKDFCAKFVGQKLKVLVEQPTKKGQMGKTEFYFDVDLSRSGLSFEDKVGEMAEAIV